jgi:cytochrome c
MTRATVQQAAAAPSRGAWRAVTVLVCAAGLWPAIPAVADDEMYKTKNCFACHRVERKHLGPAFQAIAAKYAGDAGAEARLVQKIREGSTGVWGATPMPPQPQVTAEEAVTLARWVLAQK